MPPHSVALLLPGEVRLRPSALKRHLLFFRTIVVPSTDGYDRFEDAVVDGSRRGAVAYSGMMPPNEAYVEALDSTLSAASEFVRNGSIKVVPSTYPPGVEPLGAVLALRSAMHDERVVRAAIPDYSFGAKPPVVPGATFVPGSVRFFQREGAFDPNDEPDDPLPSPADIAGLPSDWKSLAWGRLARTVKYVRIAEAIGAAPLGLDEVNQHIIPEIASQIETHQVRRRYARQAAALFVFRGDLERALVGVPWKEVEDLRRASLPAMEKVISAATQAAAGMHGIKVTANNYRLAMDRLQQEVGRIRHQQREAIESLATNLGVSAILGAAAGAATSLAGADTVLAAYPVMRPLTSLLVATLPTALTALRGEKSALAKCIATHRALRAHPLFFASSLVKRKE